MFPHLNHPKGNNDIEKIYNPNLIDLPPPPPPPPPPTNNGKQPPWCFLPQPPLGNQWLVPVRSPSEGLVYKPLAGPSPPPVGLMPPVYGMSLTPSNADFLTCGYNILTSYQQGISVFPSTSLLTSYGFPAITKQICSPMLDDSLNYNKINKTACNMDSDLQGSSGSTSNERKKDELPLFPTTPMVQNSDNQCPEEKGSDERIKVIKVVPHNPKLASESAARIFQFIQEERKYNE
ncbi:protein HEADING DATE 3B-like [Bidens hawaiensis]|uniref:protein HEADING DATE 3B-like n=1 Tax=Bidens hawaiensis TaxID=980011 RepID=UPI00404B5EDF